MATLPNGSERRVVGPVAVTLPAGGAVARTLTLNVPGRAPGGLYTLTLNVGDYPSTVDASDSFTFEKAAAAGREAGGEARLVSEGAFFGEAGSTAPAVAPAGVAVYPNPAQGRSTVRFTLGEDATGRLSVLDALGREVAVLVDGALAAGPHAYAFDGTALPAGLYLARLEIDGRVETQRFSLVR